MIEVQLYYMGTFAVHIIVLLEYIARTSFQLAFVSWVLLAIKVWSSVARVHTGFSKKIITYAHVA